MLVVVVLHHPVRKQYTLHYYSELLSVHLQTSYQHTQLHTMDEELSIKHYLQYYVGNKSKFQKVTPYSIVYYSESKLFYHQNWTVHKLTCPHLSNRELVIYNRLNAVHCKMK